MRDNGSQKTQIYTYDAIYWVFPQVMYALMYSRLRRKLADLENKSFDRPLYNNYTAIIRHYPHMYSSCFQVHLRSFLLVFLFGIIHTARKMIKNKVSLMRHKRPIEFTLSKKIQK